VIKTTELNASASGEEQDESAKVCSVYKIGLVRQPSDFVLVVTSDLLCIVGFSGVMNIEGIWIVNAWSYLVSLVLGNAKFW
jgi:hypothetical protein